jgi:hypothetical protein
VEPPPFFPILRNNKEKNIIQKEEIGGNISPAKVGGGKSSFAFPASGMRPGGMIAYRTAPPR